ncbi:MAG: outer membrane protein assembly factor BamD [Calditrichaeota bacterium]|nr:MAG: outer membrane protein assembly factor BamD [Calditrichota bacterium]
MATYGLAEVEFKLKKFDEAKSKFQDFTIVYPEHELIPKAQEYIEKSALKSGIKAFEANEFTKAKERFDQFKTEFPNSDKIDKVDDYLKKLSAMPETTAEESNDNS